jgi:hypothetical protein
VSVNLAIRSTGLRAAAAFGPVLLVRYVVATASGAAVLGTQRRTPVVVPRAGQRMRMAVGLVAPQALASGLLYLAFTYGDPAVAGATLFSSVFFSLAYAAHGGALNGLSTRKRLAAAACFLLYLAGIVGLSASRRAAAESVATDRLVIAIGLSLLAGLALAVYVEFIGYPFTDVDGTPLSARQRTVTVTAGVAVSAVVIAAAWLLLPGTTDPSDWTERWSSPSAWVPLVLLGVVTYWANELMAVASGANAPDQSEPTTAPQRNAALTMEPLLVIVFALMVGRFRNQVPSDHHDIAVQLVGCAAMSLGAMGAAAILAGAREAVAGRKSPALGQPAAAILAAARSLEDDDSA